MNILKEVIKSKREMLRKGLFPSGPPSKIKGENFFASSLARPGISVIAEIKRSSPSEGKITSKSVTELAEIYGSSPAACVSVLTEDKYFGGSIKDILKVKEITKKPVLMKDFIICREQVYLAAEAGADALLLIAALLSSEKIRELNEAALECGLKVLNEVHTPEDIKKLPVSPEITGVNSRNLSTLKVDVSLHLSIFKELPPDSLKVAESGIGSSRVCRDLNKAGYNAILAGTAVIKSPDPAAKIRELAGE